MSIMRTGGIVLCGGQSSRMGTPKAWLPVGGEPLLARVVRVLARVVSPIVVVAAEGQELPPLPTEVRVVRDALPGRGPLQGLAAGLAALRDLSEAAYVTGCDTPFLLPSFVDFLIGQLGSNDAAVPVVDDRSQPLSAVYRIATALPATEHLLANGQYSLRELLGSLKLRSVAEADLRSVDPNLDSLRGANTPEEFVALIRVGRP